MGEESALRDRAFDAMNDGDLDLAEKLFLKLLEDHAEVASEILATDLAGLAGCLVRTGSFSEGAQRYREALGVLKQSNERSPLGDVIAVSLARVLSQLGDADAAIALLVDRLASSDVASSLGSTSIATLAEELAIHYLRNGNAEKARAAAQLALRHVAGLRRRRLQSRLAKAGLPENI